MTIKTSLYTSSVALLASETSSLVWVSLKVESHSKETICIKCLLNILGVTEIYHEMASTCALFGSCGNIAEWPKAAVLLHFRVGGFHRVQLRSDEVQEPDQIFSRLCRSAHRLHRLNSHNIVLEIRNQIRCPLVAFNMCKTGHLRMNLSGLTLSIL